MGNRNKFIFSFVVIASISGLLLLMFYKPATKIFGTNDFKVNTIEAGAQVQSSTQNKVPVNKEVGISVNEKIKNDEKNNVMESNKPSDIKDVTLENIIAKISEEATITKESIKDKNISQTKQETATVKALRRFYVYAASDVLYTKAYEMLDENFTLRLDLLKKLGITELKKSDLDLDSFPMYSSLLKTAHIKRIVKESTFKGISTIYYYQAYTLGDKEQDIQPLVATLKKVKNNWFFTSIK